MSADELGAKLKSKEKSVTVIADPAEALAEAEKRSGDYDIVLFAGSLYLIGEIRRQLDKNE
jgi:folylpolyglutamate synthase/dihydropteroate synthase